MDVNTALVTSTGRDITEASVDAYRDQIAAHSDNDWSGHTSMQLHLTGYYEQDPANTQLVADATLRMSLTDSDGTASAWALPALIQSGSHSSEGSVPTILRQPESTTVTKGSSVTLSVYAASVGKIAYQWQKSGKSISGANSDQLVILSASFTDAGNYTCILSNTVGNVTSSTAALTVTA